MAERRRRGRAWRRGQRQRWMARASRLQMVAAWLRGTASEHRASVRGRVAKTRVPCSCWMCGNARRHYGTVPMQERRALLSAIDSARDAS